MLYIFKKYNEGFSLVELMVVIAIIGVLSTMAILALDNSRIKSRDVKRVADIKQLSTALELYYNRDGSYPTTLVVGEALKSANGLITYMSAVPSAPLPNDGSCTLGQNNFSYAQVSQAYVISFCLGGNIGPLSAGVVYATPHGISNSAY